MSFDAAGANLPAGRASRVPTRQLEVRFRSGRNTLAGTLTLPPGAGPHPAVAWVHGAGVQTRNYFPDLPALLSGAGLAVLAYDKQGVGQSGGVFPGDRADERAIGALARDAEAAARFLAAQPGIDRARVGLAGHSQGGWIAPLAASREPTVRFVIAFAGPSLSQGETDAWADLAGAGNSPPPQSEEQMEAEVMRQGSSGYEPMPALRALRVPSLWLFGRLDYVVPTRLSVRRLEAIGGDFTTEVYPKANHALVETQTGLTSEMLASDRFAPGMFSRVRDWVARAPLAALGREPDPERRQHDARDRVEHAPRPEVAEARRRPAPPRPRTRPARRASACRRAGRARTGSRMSCRRTGAAGSRRTRPSSGCRGC